MWCRVGYTPGGVGYTLTHFWVGFISYPTHDDSPDKFRHRFRFSNRNPWLRAILKVDADNLPNKEVTGPSTYLGFRDFKPVFSARIEL
jgi:hypothetical protein